MLHLETTLVGHSEDRVWHACWSPSGNHLATSGEDRVIRVWDINSLECVSTLEDGQSRTIRSCEWSPDGFMIASASFDGTIVIWEAQSSSLLRWDVVASLEGHENEVKCVAWNLSGDYLASCGRDKRVWVWMKLVSHAMFSTMLSSHTIKCKILIVPTIGRGRI